MIWNCFIRLDICESYLGFLFVIIEIDIKILYFFGKFCKFNIKYFMICIFICFICLMLVLGIMGLIGILFLCF